MRLRIRLRQGATEERLIRIAPILDRYIMRGAAVSREDDGVVTEVYTDDVGLAYGRLMESFKIEEVTIDLSDR